MSWKRLMIGFGVVLASAGAPQVAAFGGSGAVAGVDPTHPGSSGLPADADAGDVLVLAGDGCVQGNPAGDGYAQLVVHISEGAHQIVGPPDHGQVVSLLTFAADGWTTSLELPDWLPDGSYELAILCYSGTGYLDNLNRWFGPVTVGVGGGEPTTTTTTTTTTTAPTTTVPTAPTPAATAVAPTFAG